MSEIYNVGYGYPLPSPDNLNHFLRGEKLFRETTDFYATYVSRMIFPEEHRGNLEKLNVIMRIAKISSQNGGLLTLEEEKQGLLYLREISQELLDGASHQEITGKLEILHHYLTGNNPKALVASLITQMEYRFYLNESPHDLSLKDRLISLGNTILKKLSPHLPDIYAKAIAQGLSRVLKQPDFNHFHALETLEQLHHEWLKAI